MAKHLIGVGLFVSIVGLFAVTYSLLTVDPIPAIPPVEPAPPQVWKIPQAPHRASVGEPRAIADRRTGEVTIYLNSLPQSRDYGSDELNASFAFYVVRSDEVRLSSVVTDTLVRSVTRDNDTKWILRYKASWINSLSWEDTVYVVPSAGDVFAPFSKDIAIPVLIRN